MKLKKILSGVIAAAIAATTVVVTPILADAAATEEATDQIKVEVNVKSDFLNAILFTNGTVNYTVNDKSVEGSYWVQVNRQDKGIDTIYAGAFTTSMVEGSTEMFTFYVPSTEKSIAMKTIFWSNDAEKNFAHEVTLDATKAVDNELSVQLVPIGDVAEEISNDWYYLQAANVVYLTEETSSSEESSEEASTKESSEEASTEESSEEASTEESSTEESGTEEADSTSDYALLYDKKVEITTKYESAQIPVKAVAGDEITVTYKLNDAGEYHQLSFKHAGKGWPALTSPKYTNEYNCVDVNADGTFTFTLNAEDAANITANNLVVSGYSVTYTKVELNADKKPAEEPSSSYDTLTEKKVDDFKTDGTSELHVMSITPEDAAQYSAYEIKVTLSNGKVAKKTTSKCYDSFKYTNTSDAVSTESSAENYFIVVKIINIPADVTVSSVEITPVD